MNQSLHKFQAVLRACLPSTPPVPPQSVSASHRDPGELWKNLPLIPPSPSFLTLQSGSWKHTSFASLLGIVPPKYNKSQLEGGLGQDVGLLQTGLLSGSERPPLIPRRGCGITREDGEDEDEDGEGERCCCDGCLSLRQCARLSRSECFSSFFLSPSLHSPPPLFLPPPFSQSQSISSCLDSQFSALQGVQRRHRLSTARQD